MNALDIQASGLLTTVQDLGRPGWASLGVGASGALDRGALRLVNRLLGNAEGSAALEITLGGFEAVVRDDAWIAVTGAWGSVLVGSTVLDPNHPVLVRAGERISIGPAERGLRYYLGVRGGVAVPEVLGSRSTDMLSGVGPLPVSAGDLISIGSEPDAAMPSLDIAPWSSPSAGVVTVPLHVGPRDDWFTPGSLDLLFSQPWEVASESNRVGARLIGPRLERARDGELLSEGMVAGALQVPPSGQPTVLLADHPVTGGYPVIAVVATRALDVFAQLRPGQRVAFRHA